MRLFTSLIASAAILFSASAAFASATWSVSASTGDGSPLNAVTPGTTVTLDITLTMSAPGEMFGISGSVNDYDRGVVTPNAGASTIASQLLYATCIPTYGCFNGVSNLESGLRVQSGVEGPGAEDTFLSILSTSAVGGDGTQDSIGLGTPNQFSIVYDVVGAPGASTVLRVGTFEDYADAFAGLSDDIVNNTSVEITIAPIPEPGTALLMGLGLAGLAAAGRRE